MPVWLQRVFVVVYVLFCIELGLVLIVRGAVSGLGLLDIWLGVVEAVRYRDRV
jgi:hypothetical protein